MIAALYVAAKGCYYGMEGVEPWGLPDRDARLYDGPWPVVAHPPCKRWSRMHGFIESVYPGRFKLGDDDGCFAAALASVRRWGGVLEHPAETHAWDHFRLRRPPHRGGWVPADQKGGWTCCIEQGHYGHRARKATWLYANGCDLPQLRWGRAPGEFMLASSDCRTPEQRKRAIRTGMCQCLSKRERASTPIEFRDLLLSIAATALREQGEGAKR